jgi:ATP phosphoribosyltransferase
MISDKLVIGMPAGSLADPNRGGNLIDFLKHAGFPTKGYDQGGPTKFPLNAALLGWDGRPQEFGSQLGLGQLDIAIAGDDWIRERVLEYKYEYNQDIQLNKVLSLSRGNVRIVIIINPLITGQTFDDYFKALLDSKPLVTMVSEMPYLALDWFKSKIKALGFENSHDGYSVQNYMTPPKIDRGIVIYETWGKTEAKVVHGAVDFGLEITQTGSAIRNYGLAIGDEIMHSETGIWVNPALKQTEEKYELARMFLLNLYGSVFAENKVLLFFNAKNECADDVLRYLSGNRLFADEPTMNTGENYTEFSIQMDLNNPKLPIAKVRYELARIGATGIETVPLDSCIPSFDAIDF